MVLGRLVIRRYRGHYRMDKARRDLAELPIKQILTNYFRQFTQNNVVNWCRIKHVPMIKVPRSHLTTANIISTMRTMPMNFITSNALFYMPNRVKPLVLEKQSVPGEVWGFTLAHHPAGSPKPIWDENALDHFGNQTNQAKETVGVLLVCAKVYLQDLVRTHAELRGLSLELNTEDMVLRLVDSNLPEVGFDEYISVEAHRMTPEEIDEYLSG